MTQLAQRPATQPALRLPRVDQVGSGAISYVISLAAVSATLTTATYLYFGYTYGTWPGTAMLDFVLRAKGELANDWQTDQPAPHWAVTHFLALFPESWLEPLVLLLWIVGLVVLWAGFAEICRALGTARLVALGAGLVAVPTAFGGIGWSEPLFGSMYPQQTAFAFSVAALAAALFGRCALAGVLVGTAMLVHPSVGALSVPIAAVALIVIVGWSWRAAARFTVPLLLLAAPALMPIASSQGSRSSLSARERFELIAIVRQPHHVLYSHFGGYEYTRTVLWACLGAAGAALLWSRRPVRALAASAVAAVVGLAVGGAVSAAEAPLLLVQAQLGRLSPYVVLVGVVIGAAALARDAGGWGAAVLFATAFMAQPIANGLSGSLVSVSGVAAGVLLVALGLAVALERGLLHLRGERPVRWLAAAGLLSATLLVAFAVSAASYRTTTVRDGFTAVLTPGTVLVCAVVFLAAVIASRSLEGTVFASRPRQSLVQGAVLAALVTANAAVLVRADAYIPGVDPADRAWRNIAAVTRASTKPTDVIMTPPQNSGFRFLSHRAVVVEFGSFRYDSEDVNWARRMADTTGDPRTVDPGFGTNVYARNALIASSYDRNVEHTRVPICRYGASYVVAEAPAAVPAWLVRVAANSRYVLLRVKPGAC